MIKFPNSTNVCLMSSKEFVWSKILNDMPYVFTFQSVS